MVESGYGKGKLRKGKNMNRVELLEQIRGMPLVEQVALAEAILHGVGGQLGRPIPGLLDDGARLMYPMLAGLDPEDWEDAANYLDKP